MTRPDPVRQAERALLGAMLSDPAGQGHLLDLVDRDDMRVPFHGQVLAAMRRLRAKGEAAGPLAVHEEVKNDRDLPGSISHDGVLITDLMEASPRSEHACAYAGIIVGAAIRRQIAVAASRITQAAEFESTDSVLDMTAQARRAVTRGRARWEALPAAMRWELPARGVGREQRAQMARRLAAIRDDIRDLRAERWALSPDDVQARLAAITQHVADVAVIAAELRERQAGAGRTGEARPQGANAEAAGERLLKELAADPSHLAVIRDRIEPDNFAVPEHGEVYRVMQDLAAAGRPVDPVTVSWEASRRGIRPEAAGLRGGMGPLAATAAREVQDYAILARAARAGRDLRATADDLALTVTAFLRQADSQLTYVERTASAGERPSVGLASRSLARPPSWQMSRYAAFQQGLNVRAATARRPEVDRAAEAS